MRNAGRKSLRILRHFAIVLVVASTYISFPCKSHYEEEIIPRLTRLHQMEERIGLPRMKIMPVYPSGPRKNTFTIVKMPDSSYVRLTWNGTPCWVASKYPFILKCPGSPFEHVELFQTCPRQMPYSSWISICARNPASSEVSCPTRLLKVLQASYSAVGPSLPQDENAANIAFLTYIITHNLEDGEIYVAPEHIAFLGKLQTSIQAHNDPAQTYNALGHPTWSSVGVVEYILKSGYRLRVKIPETSTLRLRSLLASTQIEDSPSGTSHNCRYTYVMRNFRRRNGNLRSVTGPNRS